MSDQRVALEDVTYRIGNAVLVEAVNVEISAGEFVGLIGPNGAGKSTVLSLMAGSLEPTHGSVLLGGIETSKLSIRDLALARAMLGPTPPTDIPFPARTVVEAGRHPYRSLPDHDPDTDDQAVLTAMELAKVAHLSERVYSSLSSGEQARVMIARILAQRSPVALLDEPTASLDVANAENALRSLNADRDRNSTVICVLHDLNQAAYHCDRLVLIDEGNVVSTGAPEDVLDSELLSSIYGESMRVVDHPFRDCPLVLVG